MTTLELTPAFQDYLKVIWSSQEWTDKPLTTNSLAARMGFAPSTISEAVAKLTEQGLVVHPRYGPIGLTEEGQAFAIGMVRRHRLIETFLVDYLGYKWDEVHDEAEVLEHAVSNDFVDRLDDKLGNPIRDPHGDPIPGNDGRIHQLTAMRLNDAPPGETFIVVRVSDTFPEVLRHLDATNIRLDTHLRVIHRQDTAGIITITVDGEPADLGITTADAIWVAPRETS